MYFDRFDIVGAYYLALSECHSGQWSKEYERLCKIMLYFKPGHSFSFESLTDNGKEIYKAACIKFLNQ
jgi:hypothetical protein